MTNFEVDKWYLISTLKNNTVFDSFTRVANPSKKTGDQIVGIAFACFAGERDDDSILPVSPEELEFYNQSSVNSEKEINWRIISVGDSYHPEIVKNTVGIWVLTRAVNTLPPVSFDLVLPPPDFLNLYYINGPLVNSLSILGMLEGQLLKIRLENLDISSEQLSSAFHYFGPTNFFSTKNDNYEMTLTSKKTDGAYTYVTPETVYFEKVMKNDVITHTAADGSSYMIERTARMNIEFHFPLRGDSYDYSQEHWESVLGGEHVSLNIFDPSKERNIKLTLTSKMIDEIADHDDVQSNDPFYLDNKFQPKVYSPYVEGQVLTLKRDAHGALGTQTLIQRPMMDGRQSTSWVLHENHHQHTNILKLWQGLCLGVGGDGKYTVIDNQGNDIAIDEVRYSHWNNWNIDNPDYEAVDPLAPYTRFEFISYLSSSLNNAIHDGPLHIKRRGVEQPIFTICAPTHAAAAAGAKGVLENLMALKR